MYIKKERLLGWLDTWAMKSNPDEDYTHEEWQALEQIRTLIQKSRATAKVQKPEIKEEWIEEKARELWDNEWLDYLDAENFVRSLTEDIRGR